MIEVTFQTAIIANGCRSEIYTLKYHKLSFTPLFESKETQYIDSRSLTIDDLNNHANLTAFQNHKNCITHAHFLFYKSLFPPLKNRRLHHTTAVWISRSPDAQRAHAHTHCRAKVTRKCRMQNDGNGRAALALIESRARIVERIAALTSLLQRGGGVSLI